MPIGGAQTEVVADADLPHPRQGRANHDFVRRQSPLRGDHQGVVGLDRRIVVIAPQPALDRADAPDLPQTVEPGRRQQVVPPGGHALDDDFRRVLQQRCRFPPQALAEQQHGTEQEHQQGVDQQQTEVAGLAPQQGREGVINQIFLPFEESAHGGSKNRERG